LPEALIPHCFFNFLNPLPGMIDDFAGINVQQLPTEEQPALEMLPTPPLVDLTK
jgi:hypothetical protein